MNGEEVYTSDLLIAFEDIAKVWDGVLNGRTIAALALALVDNKQALISWLEAQ